MRAEADDVRPAPRYCLSIARYNDITRYNDIARYNDSTCVGARAES